MLLAYFLLSFTTPDFKKGFTQQYMLETKLFAYDAARTPLFLHKNFGTGCSDNTNSHILFYFFLKTSFLRDFHVVGGGGEFGLGKCEGKIKVTI
jgi:hypothetical protein